MIKKRILSLFTFLIIALSGCGNLDDVSPNDMSSQEFDNLIILAGNHANSVKPKYDAMTEALTNVALKYGDIQICVIDGEAYIANSVSIPEQKQGLSYNKKSTIAQSQVEQIIDFINSEGCMAKTNEVDLISSFELASRTIRSTGYVGEANGIYVFDTGLCTYGALDFSSINLNTVDVEKLLQDLASNHQIVDLSGATVYWYGLCDTVSPQEELSATQKDTVKRIWEGYIQRSGATLYWMADISTDSFENSLPYVTPIVSVTTSSEWNEEVQEAEEFPEILVYSEETLKFTAGKAELSDEEEAREQLQKTIDYMNQHESFQLLIVGCTAKWGSLEEYCKPLSESRGRTVKDILVEAGVEEDRITVIGLGYDNPFYVNDQDENGSLINTVAKDNRCIVLLDGSSNAAISIYNGSWRE